MRAFWVGLVGLLAVYRTGVHYERIPFSTPYAQRRMTTDLGPLDRYILRLDQRCNIVFAVAFMFVIFLIVVALTYLLLQPPPLWENSTSHGAIYGRFLCGAHR